jgi:hypothetical protein
VVQASRGGQAARPAMTEETEAEVREILKEEPLD